MSRLRLKPDLGLGIRVEGLGFRLQAVLGCTRQPSLVLCGTADFLTNLLHVNCVSRERDYTNSGASTSTGHIDFYQLVISSGFSLRVRELMHAFSHMLQF